MPTLALHFGERSAHIVPRSRRVGMRVTPPGESEQKARGWVEVRSGVGISADYYFFLIDGPEGGDRWVVQSVDRWNARDPYGAVLPLTAETFEAAVAKCAPMSDLDRAWDWYRASRRGVRVLEHLAVHWDYLPWDAGTDLGRDERLRTVSADQLAGDAGAAAEPLDDLAVLVLFSAFEGMVRQAVAQQVAPQLSLLTHPTLRGAADDALRAIEDGSFAKVMEPYKALDADLVERVNQVRRYRNWVGHGRRGEPGAAVNPGVAYERLRRMLEVLGAEPAS